MSVLIFLICDISTIDKSMEKEMALTLNQLLFRTFHEKDNMLQSVRDELGLGRGQPRILTYLLSHESGSQNDIASYFGIDPSAVSRMTEILRKNGFLTRRTAEDCRRSNVLELTEKGREAARSWISSCERVERKMLKGFSNDETEMLKSMLQRLLDNAAKEDEE